MLKTKMQEKFEKIWSQFANTFLTLTFFAYEIQLITFVGNLPSFTIF